MKIGYYPNKHIKNNVASFLEEHAKKQPDKVAFYFFSEDALHTGNFQHNSLTYKEFNTKVCCLSGGLFETGIKKGDRVMIFMPTSPELYLSIASLQRIGAIPVLLDSWSRKEQLTKILQNSQPSGIIATDRWLKSIRNALGIFGIKIQVVIGDNYVAAKHVIQFAQLLKGKLQNMVPVEQTDTALITYTTGSSGDPKGANRTHRFLAAQHYALKRLFPYRPDDVDLPVFPVFALNNIASGITTVIPAINISLPNTQDSKTLITQVQRCHVNCMTLAPSSFRNMATYCHAKNIVLNGITRVLTGGAPISETDIARFITVIPRSKNWILYGSTEVEPIAYIESREMLSIKPPQWTNTTKIGVNVGRIDKALDYKFIHIETGHVVRNIEIKDIEVARGEVGELVVAGEHVCQEYYKNDDAFVRTKIRNKQGIVWHRTGDLARIDTNGLLWIVGRKHNVVKRGIEYFFPVRPEIMLKDIPWVVNAAYLNCIRNNKDCVVAVVTIQNRNGTIEKLCRATIIDSFKKEKIPLDEVIFIKEIPMDVRHHSKVDYGKLRQKIYEIFA